jgi:sulfatase-like protein
MPREPFAQPAVVAASRLANALFFLFVSAYGVLSYTPFAYRQFIEPRVVPSLNDFVAVSPWLYWAMFLLTLLTLLPLVRRRAATGLSVSYLAVWGAIGIAVAIARPLDIIGSSWRALALGLLALVPPMWLALVDHLAWPRPESAAVDRERILAACLASALTMWIVYAAAAPVRAAHAVGLVLPAAGLAAGAAVALAFDLFVFMAIFLAMTAAGTVGEFTGRPVTTWWLLVGLLAISVAMVTYGLVCASMAFTGWSAALASTAIGLCAAAVWADLARLRVQGRRPGPLDALDQFCAPIAGGLRPRGALAICVCLPFVAHFLAEGVARLDWNFLLQKLGVLLIALITFAAVSAAAAGRRPRWPAASLAVPLIVFAAFHVVIEAAPGGTLDRYATIDPSFRLLRDLRTGGSAGTVEYYRFLQANTLISTPLVPAADVAFVDPLRRSPERPPHIFVFIVDSLRRDYLSPYNPAARFTPQIDAFAAESFVFDRAFTRYAGTLLALPSIWAGGLVPHTLEQPAFDRRNTLLKLLDANGYLRVMTRDDAVAGVMADAAKVVELGTGRGAMNIDVCTTARELEPIITARAAAQPIFFHSLPQDVHIGVVARRKAPPAGAYPGFFAPVAAAVETIDGCFGRFIAFLKRTNLYRNSIVILTSDHGDSLGEEGRWGHAYFVVPEVMRVPLIIHLPERMRAHVSAELGAAAFSTDLTPSLYALLGYEPADLGPLFGRPLFVSPDADVSWRRRQPFLVASSYGAVYGAIRDNGRRLFVVDAVEGRESAFDMTTSPGERLEVTQAMVEENRQFVQQQLELVAARFLHRKP